ILPEHRAAFLGANGLRMGEWLKSGHARVVKRGPHRTVYRVNLPKLNFYVKHYPLTDLRSWFRQLVRPAKARTEYEKVMAVAARGIPTYEPLGYAERANGFAPGDSIFFTRGLDATEPLNTFLEARLPQLPRERQNVIRVSLACQLGQLVARMHD